MPDSKLILAIDQGGQSTRAMLYDSLGEQLEQERVSIATRRTAPGFVEHDAEELVASVNRVVARLLRQRPRVVAAGLATQRSSIALWDRDTGTALANVISWQDTRAKKLLQRLAPDAATIRDITGLVPSAHYGASKLRWCLDNVPAVAAAAAAGRLVAGPLASFLLFRLCDARPLLADPVNASRTLLYDIEARDWSPRLLQAFAVPHEILPRCVSNRHDFGQLTGGVPLAICTGDQNAALYAQGAVDTAKIYINIGTGAFLLAPVEEWPQNNPLLRSIVFDDGIRRRYALEGTVNGAASALVEATPGASAAQVAAAAQRIGADDIPLFMNGVAGLGSPFWCEINSRFVGAGATDARRIAVLESILFLLQVNVEQVPGAESRVIVASGGLANHDGLCQALASLTGCVVSRAADTEATARGLAALVAGLPRGFVAAPAQRFLPRPMPALAARYQRWRAALDTLLQSDHDAQSRPST